MLDWTKLTIGKALQEAAGLWGDKEAVKTNTETLTYSELYEKACQLASGLSSLGIKKGDSVATVFGTVPQWIIAKYAIHLVGARLVPINISFKSLEIEYILKQSDVKTIIVTDKLRQGDFLAILSEIDPNKIVSDDRKIKSDKFPFLELIITFSPEKNKYPFSYDFYEAIELGVGYKKSDINKNLAEIKPDDICSIMFTSGSTAFPKGAMHKHTSLLGIGKNFYGSTFNLNPSHNLLCFFPFYHIAGCVYYTLGALMNGCSLYVNEFIPDEVLPIIQNEKINLFGGFDAHFNAISNHPTLNEFDLNSIKFVILATGPEWYDRCMNIFPSAELIAHHYGFTEGTGVSMNPDEKDYNVRKFSNGSPWPGIEVKVVNPETGEKVPANEPGELCLRGWSRFQGYYKNSEETKKAIDSEGYFHTGDYGWLDEKGNVYYRGRYKMMIKSGGENVSEREVEMFLEGLTGVKSVQIIGVPDKTWGEAVTAIIEPDEKITMKKDDVINYCKGKIATFKIPKYVLFIKGSEWPLIGPGKVDKKQLKQWALKNLNLE